MLESILGWAVFTAIIGFIAAAGVNVVSASPPDYTFAKQCFSASYLILILRVGWWVIVEQPGEASFLNVVGVFFLFICIGISWMFTMSWVDTKQLHDPSAKRRAQQEALTSYVIEGTQLRETYKSPETIPRTAVQEWEGKVFQYLEETLGRPVAVQFRRPNTTQPIFKAIPPNMSEENYMTIQFINMRLAQLDELIKILMG